MLPNGHGVGEIVLDHLNGLRAIGRERLMHDQGVDMTGLVSRARLLDGHRRGLMVGACDRGTTWARGSIDG
jgi:hypothetical protein